MSLNYMCEISSAIDKVISDFGPEILEDEKRFINAIEDLAPYLENDIKTIKLIYNADLGLMIKEAYVSNDMSIDYSQDIKNYIINEIGLNEKKYFQFLNYFSFLSRKQDEDTKTFEREKSEFDHSIQNGVELMIMNRIQAEKIERETRFYTIGKEVYGSSFSKYLLEEPVFKFLYNKRIRRVGIKNLSDFDWEIVRDDNTMELCRVNKVVVINKGDIIRIINDTVQLNVLRINIQEDQCE